jgi:ribokinase
VGVLVVGSLNIDIVTYLDQMPLPGQTVAGNRLEFFPGGKGLNQAVAAARAGGQVVMVGVLGNDVNSKILKDVLVHEKINHNNVHEIAGVCGTAIIEVDKDGQNRIIVIPGTNAQLKSSFVTPEILNNVSTNKILLAQLECPISELVGIFGRAKESGFFNILNPAPAYELSPEFLSLVDLLVPNQFEAEFLTNIKVVNSETAFKAGEKLLELGVKSVLITMAEQGCALISKDEKKVYEAFKTNPIDTTAAGDAFCGSLAVALSEGLDLDSAIRFASASGALAVKTPGAIPSLPTREQISLLTKS